MIIHMGWQRLLLAALSGVLLFLSIPPADQGWLAWLALSPLLLACQGVRPFHAACLGLLTGCVYKLGVFYWIFEVEGFGLPATVLLALYLGSYTAAWSAGVALIHRPAVYLWFAPALWVCLDYLLAHAGFLALPWATLAQSQHHNLAVLQIASITGEYGVSFLVVLSNAAVALVLKQYSFWRTSSMGAAVIMLAHLGGWVVLDEDKTGSTLRVAVVQPGFIRGGDDDPLQRLLRLKRQSIQAARSGPDIIVWPEAAVRNSRSADIAGFVVDLSNTLDIPVLYGASDTEKFGPEQNTAGPVVRLQNMAMLADPRTGLSQAYYKIRPLPFGEYIPHPDIISWPEWLVPRHIEMQTGTGPRLFDLPAGGRAAFLICWESAFAGLARDSVADGANLLVHISNGNWFGKTAFTRQQNLASVLRAVETGVPVVVASNTGPSQIISRTGRVIVSTGTLYDQQVIVSEVIINNNPAIYARYGDVFMAFIGVWLLLMPILRLWF